MEGMCRDAMLLRTLVLPPQVLVTATAAARVDTDCCLVIISSM